MQSIEMIKIKTGTALTDADFENLEKEMLKLPQSDCPVIHRFSPGLYIREVTLPAGTFAIGHYQKTEHLNIMLTGSVTNIRDDGSTDLLKAPLMYTAKPGRLVRNCDGKLEECRRQCRRRTGNGPAWLSRAEVTSCSGTSPS